MMECALIRPGMPRYWMPGVQEGGRGGVRGSEGVRRGARACCAGVKGQARPGRTAPGLTLVGEDLGAGLEPGHVLGALQQLGDNAAQRAQHGPARVDDLARGMTWRGMGGGSGVRLPSIFPPAAHVVTAAEAPAAAAETPRAHLNLAVAGEGLGGGGQANSVPAVVAGVLALQVGGRVGAEGAQELGAVGAVPAWREAVEFGAGAREGSSVVRRRAHNAHSWQASTHCWLQGQGLQVAGRSHCCRCSRISNMQPHAPLDAARLLGNLLDGGLGHRLLRASLGAGLGASAGGHGHLRSALQGGGGCRCVSTLSIIRQ